MKPEDRLAALNSELARVRKQRDAASVKLESAEASEFSKLVSERLHLEAEDAGLLKMLDRALEMPASTDSRSLSLRRTLRLARTGIWVH